MLPLVKSGSIWTLSPLKYSPSTCTQFQINVTTAQEINVVLGDLFPGVLLSSCQFCGHQFGDFAAEVEFLLHNPDDNRHLQTSPITNVTQTQFPVLLQQV